MSEGEARRQAADAEARAQTAQRTAALRQFMHEHPDFRYSRLSMVLLHDPWVLATQNASREHLLRNLFPLHLHR